MPAVSGWPPSHSRFGSTGSGSACSGPTCRGLLSFGFGGCTDHCDDGVCVERLRGPGRRRPNLGLLFLRNIRLLCLFLHGLRARLGLAGLCCSGLCCSGLCCSGLCCSGLCDRCLVRARTPDLWLGFRVGGRIGSLRAVLSPLARSDPDNGTRGQAGSSKKLVERRGDRLCDLVCTSDRLPARHQTPVENSSVAHHRDVQAGAFQYRPEREPCDQLGSREVQREVGPGDVRDDQVVDRAVVVGKLQPAVGPGGRGEDVRCGVLDPVEQDVGTERVVLLLGSLGAAC